MKETARQQILRTLALSPTPLAVHQLGLIGISETAASARLREMRRDGLVIGEPAPGKHFKVWRVTGA